MARKYTLVARHYILPCARNEREKKVLATEATEDANISRAESVSSSIGCLFCVFIGAHVYIMMCCHVSVNHSYAWRLIRLTIPRNVKVINKNKRRIVHLSIDAPGANKRTYAPNMSAYTPPRPRTHINMTPRCCSYTWRAQMRTYII